MMYTKHQIQFKTHTQGPQASSRTWKSLTSICCKTLRKLKLSFRQTQFKKILKKFKYNLYQEIQQEITKCQMDITQLEIEQLTLDFNPLYDISNLENKLPEE